MKYILLTLLIVLSCSIETIDDSDEFTIPETPYIGPLAGSWNLKSPSGLTLNGVPTDHGPSTITLYSSWDMNISIIDIDGEVDCIAYGQWYFDPPGVFNFNIENTTNPSIINTGITYADYVYTNSPQGLFIGYSTVTERVITIDTLK